MEMFTAFVLFHTLRNSKQRHMILHKHAIVIIFKTPNLVRHYATFAILKWKGLFY